MASSLSLRLARAGGGPAARRLLKIFSASVIDQAVLSAANFAVGFLLIRLTTDDDYALYVLVLTAQQLMVTIQRAWLSGPLTLVVAKKAMAERLSSIGAVKDAQRRLLLRLLLLTQLVPLGGYLLSLLTWNMALLVSLAAGLCLLMAAAGRLGEVIAAMSSLAARAEMPGTVLPLLLRVIGVATLCELGTQLCRDAGEGGIAAKIEMGGKLMVLAMAMPIAMDLIELVLGILPS